VILFHLANVLYLISYAVRDIMWLRAVTVLAGLALIGSFFQSPEPPWPAIVWNLLFFVINVVRIHLLWRERRPVPLSADEALAGDLAFAGLRPRELVRLLGVGRFVDHAAGETIVARGRPLADLALVVRGAARVQLGDGTAIAIAPGAFVGELGYLTGKPPGADVVAADALRVVRWPVAGLRAFLTANPDLRAVMQHAIGADLAAKLRRDS
jgi:hypothetical protein